MHLSFFLYCYLFHHRVVHSFPTRRSSDLAPAHLALAELLGPHAARQQEQARQEEERAAKKGGARRGSRSEEHTSELQSPCNIVCRLLLEKKNKSFMDKYESWK